MKLQNERYEVTFDLKGGEIASFLDKETNIQYMWQGDANYWTGKNPSLFPLVGNVYTKEYQIDGKTYSMKNHGLIRYATLKLKSQSENELVMELDSDEETLKQYPFAFHYEIAYKLVDNLLTITYNITNKSDVDMPFTFGLHPGFNCPLCEGETFEDYKVVFACEENVDQIVYDMKEPYTTQKVSFKEWNCNYEDLKKYDTIIYKDCVSPYVTLVGTKGHGVEMSIAGYPYFAMWNIKSGSPYLCLEPWYGHADFSAVDVAFADREGMLSLSPNKTFTTSYTIKVF